MIQHSGGGGGRAHAHGIAKRALGVRERSARGEERKGIPAPYSPLVFVYWAPDKGCTRTNPFAASPLPLIAP